MHSCYFCYWADVVWAWVLGMGWVGACWLLVILVHRQALPRQALLIYLPTPCWSQLQIYGWFILAVLIWAMSLGLMIKYSWLTINYSFFALDNNGLFSTTSECELWRTVTSLISSTSSRGKVCTSSSPISAEGKVLLAFFSPLTWINELLLLKMYPGTII